MIQEKRHACRGRLHYEPLSNVLASLFSSGDAKRGGHFDKNPPPGQGHLYEADIHLNMNRSIFTRLLTKQLTLHDYLNLDESVILYYFQMWQEEDDPILSDLCSRFVNRNLFKYVEFDPASEYKKLTELATLFKKAGIDPEYYLVVDSRPICRMIFIVQARKRSGCRYTFVNAKWRNYASFEGIGNCRCDFREKKNGSQALFSG